jgi:hypothetical protein
MGDVSTAYEDKTDRGFRNFGKKLQTPGNHAK